MQFLIHYLCGIEALEEELIAANGLRLHGCLDLVAVSDSLSRLNRQKVVIVAGLPFSDDPAEIITAVILIKKRQHAAGKAIAAPVGKVEPLYKFTRADAAYVFPDLVTRLRNFS